MRISKGFIFLFTNYFLALILLYWVLTPMWYEELGSFPRFNSSLFNEAWPDDLREKYLDYINNLNNTSKAK